LDEKDDVSASDAQDLLVLYSNSQSEIDRLELLDQPYAENFFEKEYFIEKFKEEIDPYE
jgi:hypothetical protein